MPGEVWIAGDPDGKLQHNSEEQQKGKVLAVGNGRILDNGTRVPLDIREGDTVLYSKYGGTEVKIDGELYLIVNERDILGVIL